MPSPSPLPPPALATRKPLGTWDKFAFAAAFVLIIAVGRQFRPQESMAATDAPARSLGHIVNPRESVEILTRNGQTLYRVRDAQGTVIADDLTSETLSAHFPSLTPASMTAGRIMLADPDAP